MRSIPVVIAVVFVSTVVAATQLGSTTKQKKPWEWTDEERIALRTNAELAHDRVVTGGRVRATSVSPERSPSTPWVDAFDGKTHAELFLPHEVFRELINLTFRGDAGSVQLIRDGFLREVRGHGLPADFWEQLQSISAPYVANLWAEKDLLGPNGRRTSSAKRDSQAELAVKRIDVCRSRADALAEARSVFGRERFDRFLYEVIAVNMFYAADRLPDADVLRKAEGGCR